MAKTETCPTCEGAGVVGKGRIKLICPTCNGKGTIKISPSGGLKDEIGDG